MVAGEAFQTLIYFHNIKVTENILKRMIWEKLLWKKIIICDVLLIQVNYW